MKVIIGNHEGSIVQTATGWTGVISLGFDRHGKRQRIQRKGRTKGIVTDKLRKAVQEREEGLKRDKAYTVERAVNDLMDEIKRQGRAANTIRAYTGHAKKQITPFIGSLLVADLEADDVEEWLIGRSEVLTTQTLQIVHMLLTRALKRAQRKKLCAQNVSALVDTPKGKPARKSRSMTVEQASAVLALALKGKHRIGAYVILAIQSGLRTDELRALTWNDVDLEEGTVYVIRADRESGDTKTVTSRRGLGISAMSVDALRALRSTQAAEKLAAGQAYEDHGLVFCHENGTPYKAEAVIHRFRKLLRDVPGIDPKEWTPRELRHTFVSVMSDHGVDLGTIADLVGHKSTAITERVYRHQLKPVIKTGAEVMGDVFGATNAS